MSGKQPKLKTAPKTRGNQNNNRKDFPIGALESKKEIPWIHCTSTPRFDNHNIADRSEQ